jgi:hypothetical protein
MTTLNVEILRHKNPAARRFSKFAVVNFKTGERWVVGNLFGFIVKLSWMGRLRPPLGIGITPAEFRRMRREMKIIRQRSSK